jgi:hypothetical protein
MSYSYEGNEVLSLQLSTGSIVSVTINELVELQETTTLILQQMLEEKQNADKLDI